MAAGLKGVALAGVDDADAVADEGLHELIADDLDAVDDLGGGGLGGVDGEGEVEVVEHREDGLRDGGDALLATSFCVCLCWLFW